MPEGLEEFVAVLLAKEPERRPSSADAARVTVQRLPPQPLLDLDGFYTPLLAWITQALQRGFIPSALKDVLLVRSEPAELVRALLTHQPPASGLRWIRD